METPIISNIVPKDWEAQRNKIAKDLDDLAAKAEKIVVRLDPSSMKEAQGLVSRYSKDITELTRLEQVHAATMRERQSLQQREITLSGQINNATSAQATNIAALNLTKKELNRVTALQVQLQTSEAGSYNALAAQYGLNVIELNKYSQAQIDASVRLKTMQDNTYKLREEMARLKAATNDNTLRVGEYERALGGTAKKTNNAYFQTFQLTQVMRELPNFAIDARVGFMAISNNLPQLAEGFKNLARSTVQVTDAMGNVTTKTLGNIGALKQFARSLLSLNTIMIVFSTLLVLLNNSKIREWFAGLTRTTNAAASAQRAYNKALKEGVAASDLAKYSDLGVKLKMAESGTYDADDAVKEYNKTLGVAYGKVNDLSGALAGYKAYGDDYVKVTIAMAASTQVLGGSADAMVKKYKAQRDIERLDNVDSLREMYSRIYREAEQQEGGLAKLYEFMSKIDRPFFDKAQLATRSWGQDLRKLYESEGGNKFLGLMSDLAEQTAIINANQKLSQKILEGAGVTELIEEQTTATRGVSIVERDRYEKSLFYTTNRLKVEKRLYELEVELSKTTAEGVLNDYTKREEAAKEYHQLRTELLGIELAAETKKAEEELKSDEKTIKNLLKAYKGGQDKLIHEQTLSDGTKVKLTEEMNAQLLRMRENNSVLLFEAQDTFDMGLLQSARELSENLRAIEADRYSDEVYRLKVSNEEKLKLIDEFAEKQRIAAEKMTPVEIMASAFGVDRDEDFQNLRLDHEENTARLNEQMAFVSEKLAIARQAGEDEKELMRELAEVERSIEDEKRAYMLNSLKIISEKTKEAYKEMAQSIKDSVSGIIEAYNDTQQKRTDEESERLDKERDERLGRLDEEALTEEAITKEKERINDEYDKKQAQLEEEQERRERNAFLLEQGLALAGIWVKYGQTMAAYTLAEAELAAALAAILGPAAPAAAVAAYAQLKTAAAVTAGANSALIAAQTIPAFADGGMMEQTGTALVGDASLWGKPSKHEVLLYPTGQVGLTPDSPTLMNLPKGTRVYPDADKLPTLRDIERKIIVNSIFNSKEIVDELRTLVAITDKKPRLIDQAKLRRQYRQ